jgi:hypothetical protein
MWITSLEHYPLLVPAESFLFQQDGTILKGTLLQKIAQSNFLLSIPTEKEGYFSESQLPRLHNMNMLSP